MHYIIFHTKKINFPTWLTRLIDRLSNRRPSETTIIPCIDGVFAAYACWSKIQIDECDYQDPSRPLMPYAVLVPGLYGKPPKLPNVEPGDKIYLLDVTYSPKVIEGWADRGATVEVLDHHKTALNDLSGLSDRILQRFDMDRSGAVIAWQCFRLPAVPELYRYVQDRDLWRKKLPGCDLIHLALMSQLNNQTPVDCMKIMQHLLTTPIDTLLAVGRKIQPQVDRAIQEAIDDHGWKTICGYRVPIAYARSEHQKDSYSDIAHRLLDLYPDAPFAAVEFENTWSLRSTDDRVDVSAIAKQLGGGGHRNAAGCPIPFPVWHWKYWERKAKRTLAKVSGR